MKLIGIGLGIVAALSFGALLGIGIGYDSAERDFLDDPESFVHCSMKNHPKEGRALMQSLHQADRPQVQVIR